MLDAFEGVDYTRQLITAQLGDGVEVESYVYAINLTNKQ